jgi:wobble nucleotide-excising tRNase
MINKITVIKKLAVFDNFEWDRTVLNDDGRPMRFQKINILYGRNYSGKTTLSLVFRALETGIISDKYENPIFVVSFDDGTSIDQKQLSTCKKRVRVFNEDFVRDNLRFISNPEDAIKPFAILGDENNTIEKEIAALESQLGSKEDGKETGLYASLKAHSKAYSEVNREYGGVESKLEEKLTDKATGRVNGIKYKSDRFGDQNYTKPKLVADIQNVMAGTYIALDDERKAAYGELLVEQAKVPILNLSTIVLSWKQYCTQTGELLSRKIGMSNKISELLRDVALNEWVKKGCQLHEGKQSTCSFCGNAINDKRWDILHRHFDEESKELEMSIDSLLDKIEMEKKLVKDGFSVDKNHFYSRYHKKIEQLLQSFLVVSKNYIDQLGLISEQLIKRKTEITVPLTFSYPIDYSKELISIWTSYEELCSESNEFSSKLSNEQTKARKALRLQEVYEFCCNIGYADICSQMSILHEKVQTTEKVKNKTQEEITAKEAEIQDKRRLLNDEEKGAVQVNKYLTSFFGHDYLSLQAVEDNTNPAKKIRFEIMREGKRAYHLSEGECSLIAFCYFMAKLGDIETKDTKPIIWIDDPISSLDGNHIFFVYSLIAAEIAEKGSFEQLFISTHNLDFLKYLKRLNRFEKQENGKLKSCEKQYFILNRQGQYSMLLQMPKYLKEYGTEFNYLFSCIYKCSCITTVDDTNYELFYNFGNNARKFLEIYLYFKYPDFSEDKLQRFFGEDRIPPILVERINNEYSHLAGSVERAAMPVEVPEMVSTAKLIIDKVKEDSNQYQALMNSIGLNVRAEE